MLKKEEIEDLSFDDKFTLYCEMQDKEIKKDMMEKLPIREDQINIVWSGHYLWHIDISGYGFVDDTIKQLLNYFKGKKVMVKLPEKDSEYNVCISFLI